MPCELVATGWYSSTAPRNYRTVGDDVIRSADFRPLWWRSLDTFAAPERVLIVDSASPVKADDARFTKTPIERIELFMNPGHSQNGLTHYCGYMAGVILGLEYALLNDVDLFVYVEQDALLYGERIMETTKNALRRRDLVFGRTSDVDIQQSFFAANKRGIRRFLRALHAIDFPDKRVAPEHKFMFAGTSLLPAPFVRLAVHTRIDKLRRLGLVLFSTLCRSFRHYELLPFGYGRERPINFDDEVFYFQHGSVEEIAAYKARTGF